MGRVFSYKEVKIRDDGYDEGFGATEGAEFTDEDLEFTILNEVSASELGFGGGLD